MPAFHLVRTAQGNRWIVSHALPVATRRALEGLLRAEPTLPLAQLERTPPRAEAALAELGGVGELYRGPAFVFPEEPMSPRGGVELIVTPRDLRPVPELAWVRDVAGAALPICVARNAEGQVVAVCHSSRALPTAAAAGVETAVAYRGHGLGTAVVAGWAAAVRTEERTAFYGTSWSNGASRAIASRLGLLAFGEDVHPS